MVISACFVVENLKKKPPTFRALWLLSTLHRAVYEVCDLTTVHRFTISNQVSFLQFNVVLFQARVDVDKDGNGANVYAYTFDMSRGRSSGCYLQDLIWERHHGAIPRGLKVSHKNNVSVGELRI